MNPGSTEGTVEVKVVLGRRLTSNIMTIFMPSILLNIIGHSTNYYKPKYFDEHPENINTLNPKSPKTLKPYIPTY